MLRAGQVVVEECNRANPFSRSIAKATRSQVTHTFIVGARGEIIEAAFPRVRRVAADAKVADLRRQQRAFAVLDVPDLNVFERLRVALKAETYVGRYYDVGQLLLYWATGQFWQDGAGTLVCSRLITASYYAGLGLDLFPQRILDAHYGHLKAGDPRLADLKAGYVTPVDLLWSRLELVEFVPSATTPTFEALRGPEPR